MNFEKIDQICKEKSERRSNGKVVMGFMVLFIIAILMRCQPAKEDVTPQPVYQEKGIMK